jgi:predicted DNA-binding protein
MTSTRKRTRGAETPTEALFVRLPAEHARRLDRAAFELRTPKQALVSELVERYVDPDSAASLAALAPSDVDARARSDARISAASSSSRRRVTIETLEPDTPVVGHHSFRPLAEPEAPVPEVLNSEQAAALLQVEVRVVEELASAGELPGRSIAGEWRFSRQALIDWLSHPPASPIATPADGERVPER